MQVRGGLKKSKYGHFLSRQDDIDPFSLFSLLRKIINPGNGPKDNHRRTLKCVMKELNYI